MRPLFPALALLAALAAPAVGSSPAAANPALLADPTGTLVARPTRLGVRIERAGAQSSELSLAQGTTPAGLLSLGERWLLTAVRPTSGSSAPERAFCVRLTA